MRFRYYVNTMSPGYHMVDYLRGVLMFLILGKLSGKPISERATEVLGPGSRALFSLQGLESFRSNFLQYHEHVTRYLMMTELKSLERVSFFSI